MLETGLRRALTVIHRILRMFLAKQNCALVSAPQVLLKSYLLDDLESLVIRQKF